MQMKIILKKLIGIILIIAGLFALFTPLTPGSWLALIGLELLGIHLLFFRRFLNDKQKAAFDRFMKKIKLKTSVEQDDKPGTREE
jgi:hypothetical protein